MTITSMLKDKNILLFGLGRQGGGQGDLAYLRAHGYRVRVTDEKTAAELGLAPDALEGIPHTLGGHDLADIDWADLVIQNPGVRDDHPLLLRAKAAGKLVAPSIALFVKYAPVTIIGITGTRGKSTTTALIYALLSQAYPGMVIQGGNIPGTSGLGLFDQLEGIRYAVLELSSFQLHSFHALRLSPPISVVTNLYEDHLNRYRTMSEYQRDKEAICLYQGNEGICLYNAGNSGAVAIARQGHGQKVAYQSSEVAAWSTPLPGLHNRENLAAMAKLASILQIPQTVAKSTASTFTGLAYRQQVLGTYQGVTYIDDTTATTPVAAQKALAAQQTPFIWVTGGASKNLDYTELVKSAADHPALSGVVILGSRAIPDYVAALRTALGEKILGQVDSMAAAVTLARAHAAEGTTVLLSPGFASFDLFQNEFDRGRQFDDLVTSNLQGQSL
jgi:UDP-N-acetylmuramoylalanine--D-glutamate ligase